MLNWLITNIWRFSTLVYEIITNLEAVNIKLYFNGSNSKTLTTIPNQYNMPHNIIFYGKYL